MENKKTICPQCYKPLEKTAWLYTEEPESGNMGVCECCATVVIKTDNGAFEISQKQRDNLEVETLMDITNRIDKMLQDLRNKKRLQTLKEKR